MTVGFQANINASFLNQQLGQIAVNLRDSMDAVNTFFALVNSLGVTGLGNAGLGTAPNPANPGSISDAQYFFNISYEQQTIAAVYFGTAAQTPAFNFALAVLPPTVGQ